MIDSVETFEAPLTWAHLSKERLDAETMITFRRNRLPPGSRDGVDVLMDAAEAMKAWRDIRRWIADFGNGDVPAITGLFSFTRRQVRVDREMTAVRFRFKNVSTALYFHMSHDHTTTSA